MSSKKNKKKQKKDFKEKTIVYNPKEVTDKLEINPNIADEKRQEEKHLQIDKEEIKDNVENNKEQLSNNLENNKEKLPSSYELTNEKVSNNSEPINEEMSRDSEYNNEKSHNNSEENDGNLLNDVEKLSSRVSSNEENTSNNTNFNHPEKKKKSSKKKEKKKQENNEKVIDEEKNINKQENNSLTVEKTKNIMNKKPVNPNSEEYIQYKARKRKNILYTLIIMITIIMVIAVFSTIFAFLNMSNSNIISGVSIKGIDVSNLSKEDATKKVEAIFNAQLSENITAKYNDFEATISLEKIQAEYEVNKLIDEAFLIGRSDNIIQNNYEILYVAIFNKNISPELKYKEKELDSIVSEISLAIPGAVQEYTYHIEDEELIITKGKDGKTVDKEKFKEDILNAIDKRVVNIETGIVTDEKVDIPVIDKKADSIDIEAIQKEIYKEPKDAYYIEEPFQLFPEVLGVDLGVTIEEAKKVISEDKEEYKIPVEYQKPKTTVEDLGREAFPYKISEATTKYDASNRNRSENLRIAASKIDGTVLLPGETFSYNQVVGERTVAEGYRNAAIYAGGGVVDGLAGGICQISSTLYNAVLLANLEIVERHNHSFKTSYLPTGRDATVVWGTKDFQFTNTRTYPIKIVASVDSGIASFEIYGIKEETEYTVKIIPVNTSTIPYKTQYIPDNSLESGVEKVIQSGAPGYRTTTYKELWLDGEMVSKEVISTDVYNAMTRIVHVGTAE